MRTLFVPALRRGMGSGHLRRCAELARRLGAEAAVLLEGCREDFGVEPEALLESLGLGSKQVRFVESYDPSAPWDLVVLDKRAATAEELGRFAGVPVVGFDQGGEARRYAAYLVDLLPTPPGLRPPNLQSFGPLFLRGSPAPAPRAARPAAGPPAGPAAAPARILLSFGGEDPADLSARMLEVLIRRLGVAPARLSVVQGALFERHEWPAGVEVLKRPERLADLLESCDVVFTSFGLTSFEALAAGVPVVNLNPSRYHRRLSRSAGIPEVGVGRPRLRSLRRLLADPSAVGAHRDYASERFRPLEDVAGFFAALRPDTSARCPLCGREGNPAEARFARRSYFRCRTCGLTYLLGFGLESRRYGRDYFGEEYRLQYGRTYLEDFESIKEAGRRRLRVIRRILERSSRKAAARDRNGGDSGAVAAGGGQAHGARPRLLDVGCAYGPFLAAAREMGFGCEGLDISRAAVEHVCRALGIPCRLGDFETGGQDPWPEGTFDVVSLWYVIEHFRNPAAVLERAARLLRPGGVLALATPNGRGISARADREAFLRASPDDHRTVWGPRAARAILRRFGFRPVATVVTGHHPERFPRLGSLSGHNRLTGLIVLIGLISRAFRLGDTFELYAVRREGQR